MNKKRKIGWLLLIGVCVGMAVLTLLGRSVTHPAAGYTYASRPVYTVTDSFDADQLNTRMWISHRYRLDSSRAINQLLPRLPRQFYPNTGSNSIAHGNAAHVPVGWAFVALRNATAHAQALVLSMPQYRCNQATLFVGRGNPGHKWRFDSVGTVRNTTPLGNRFFPSLNLAFPVRLPPHATVPLLLRTESRVGFHEVDVQLAKQTRYARTAFINTIRDGSQVIICFMLALVALLIGWRSANRLMLTLSGYLFSLGLAFSCLFGYLSFLSYPAWTSVNAATLGTLFRLGISITVHPFLYEVVKPAIHNRRLYKRLVLGFCGVSAFFIGLHLMPYQYYGSVNYPINQAMTYLDIINTVWIGYIAVLAYRRARIWSLLVVCLILFVPILINLLLSLVLTPDGQDSFRTPVAHPMLIILALSYLTFEQFRREVITRQLLQRQVRQVRQDINALRRQEIEGIGRDLHDQVGNTLATALGYLSRLPTDTERPRAIIVNAIRELRFLSHNLVKDDDRSLTDKVETLVSRINDFSTIVISFADYTQQQINQLSDLKQQNLYSIVQELLTNVIRHSQATQASVQFFCDGTTVDVSVEDDGIGFVLPLKTGNGIGIQNIYKRAALSGIDVLFDAAPNGTSVLLKTSLSDADPNHPH